MAAKNAKRGIKRFLEQSTSDRVDQGKSECSHVRSKRLKTMLDPDAAGESNKCQNEMQLRDNDENAAQGESEHFKETNSCKFVQTDTAGHRSMLTCIWSGIISKE